MKKSPDPISRRQFVNASLIYASGASLALHSPGLGAVSADSRERIRIGQIGTKHAHAAGKMEAMRKFSDLFDVVGIVEPDPVQRRAVENHRAYQGLNWLSERQLLETKNLRAVAVETDVLELVPTGIRCLEAGLHVHLDKPAGISMSQCRRLHSVSAQQRRTIQMGYMFRYNPGFTFLFETVRSGWLGRITQIDGLIGKKASPELRRELGRYAGGGMFELACHLIDALATVSGRPDAIHPFTQRSQPAGDAVADNQLAVFQYPGVLATIRCNHLDPFGVPRRQFNVVGTEGAIEIRPLEPPRLILSLSRARGDFQRGTHEIPLAKMSGRYDGEFIDLARIIRGEGALAWTAEHDLLVHEMILRASGMSVDDPAR